MKGGWSWGNTYGSQQQAAVCIPSISRQKQTRMMWNDDLAQRVTGGWVQLGASGSRRGAAQRTADRDAALRIRPPTCESRLSEPARHLTGCEAMKQQEGTVIKRVQVTEVEEGVR
ncbi:hypothetical protein XENOCAPTIV_021990 [Xenoophorus captivus]|uniref:Uncharacterized protein n=1 Tax=Xenoophorus captivus TaxID=1517983 RepID=A0ABV0QET3_9TELE